MGSDGSRRDVAGLVGALRANTQRLVELEELARVGSWEWDVSSDAVTWSDEMFRIFGVKPDQFDANFEAYIGCLHPEDRDAARAAVVGALSHRRAYAADYRVVWPDGQRRWLHCRGRAVTDSRGNVIRLLGTTQDITDRKQLETQLAHQALHDPLTGLANRSLLLDRLTHAIERTLRTHRHTAVFFIDIDRFKNVNDGAGHETGDVALQTISRRLEDAVRQHDTVARYGGDEFVVITEDLQWPQEGVDVGVRLLSAIRAPITHPNCDLEITASIGATVVAQRSEPSTVLRDADAAMYQAKQQGGDRVGWSEAK